MSKVMQLEKEYSQVGTIHDLSAAFESIASIHLAQIKDKVISSTIFFNELWHIYTQLRVDENEAIGRRYTVAPAGSFALLAVTSSGGLIGDIDERIIQAITQDERLAKAEVFVVGGHGTGLLAQHGIATKQSFILPQADYEVSVGPIVKALSGYETVTVYYEQYRSLSRQEVTHIDLFSVVSQLAQNQLALTSEVISSHDYLFEPSQHEIVAYMESVMIEIALNQIILESKLAQYASRFNAMSAAKSRAKEMRQDVNMLLHRAKRAKADEQTKQLFSAMKLRRSV